MTLKIPRDFTSDSRALSTLVGYTSLLAITAIILVSVITGANLILTGETDIVTTNQLETNAAKLSDEIVTVHSIATASTDSDTTINSTVELPKKTVKGQYFITVTSGEVEFTTAGSDITVSRDLPPLDGSVSVTSNGRIDGGTVMMCYDGGSEIEIRERCSK